MNEVAKFLEEQTKNLPPELAEDYYQYCKSLLTPIPKFDEIETPKENERL